MGDDIVTKLRRHAKWIESLEFPNGSVAALTAIELNAAVDKIEELQQEIILLTDEIRAIKPKSTIEVDDLNEELVIIYGPMWQFECSECNFMGDCWDTELEARKQASEHSCIDYWRSKVPSDMLDRIIQQEIEYLREHNEL